MKNDLDSKVILRAFDIISKKGQYNDGIFLYDGLKAYTDFDGYTVFIENQQVKLRLGFHNTYHLDYATEADKQAFISQIIKITAA